VKSGGMLPEKAGGGGIKSKKFGYLNSKKGSNIHRKRAMVKRKTLEVKRDDHRQSLSYVENRGRDSSTRD